MNQASTDATAVAPSRATLFSKVALMLSGSIGLSAVGTYLGRNMNSNGEFIALMIAFFVGAFAVPAIARRSTAYGLAALSGWVFISGLFIGPAINMYAHSLGTNTVLLAYLGTGAVMAVCGAFGALSGRDFSGLGRILMIALFALITVMFVGLFIGFSTGATLVFSLAGMVVFAGFFIFDFFRLSRSANTSYNAIELTMSLYLDYINFLLFLLRFLSIFVGGSGSSSKK